ncbi:MAG: family hydrolase [Frankiales bacterium]|nr:family hydrolase [Frankiales bacterium]
MTDDVRGWLTFDCYGTLIDWRTGMSRALSALDDSRVEELLSGYHRYEPGLQLVRPMLPYREVLRIGLAAAAQGIGRRLSDTEERVLAETMPTWPPFPETAATLQRLRQEGWRLGVLSNVDNDIIAQTLPLLGAPIDVVVTAEDVGSYKPALAHFEEFRRIADPAEGRWVHVACSWTHDVVPVEQLGTPAVFVNREGEEYDPGRVLAVTTDLVDLPGILEAHLPR